MFTKCYSWNAVRGEEVRFGIQRAEDVHERHSARIKPRAACNLKYQLLRDTRQLRGPELDEDCSPPARTETTVAGLIQLAVR